MATLKFELRNRPDKKGFCPIRVVIQDKGKRVFVPLPIKLHPKFWDKKTQRVTAEHSQATVINSALKLRLTELQSQMISDELKGCIDLNKLAGKNIGKDSFNFFALQCLSRWEKSKAASTLRAYASQLKNVNAFDRNSTLQSITPDWLVRYEAHSRTACKKTNGLKRLKFVSVIIHEALRQGLIEKNPFLIYKKPKWGNPKKEWLTIEEMALLEKYYSHIDIASFKHTIAWYLFSCYTGLRYSDAAQFNSEKNVKNGRIILYTQKTGDVVSIKITQKLKRWLKVIEKAPLYSNPKINAYLKTIASLAGLNKSLSFHTARHTFAVNCAALGISQEVTGKLLGHSDLRTTGIYYKIVNTRIDKEMEKWDKK